MREYWSEKIKNGRKDCGMTLEELARRADIPVEELAELEAGQASVSPAYAERLCDVLSLSNEPLVPECLRKDEKRLLGQFRALSGPERERLLHWMEDTVREKQDGRPSHTETHR